MTLLRTSGNMALRQRKKAAPRVHSSSNCLPARGGLFLKIQRGRSQKPGASQPKFALAPKPSPMSKAALTPRTPSAPRVQSVLKTPCPAGSKKSAEEDQVLLQKGAIKLVPMHQRVYLLYFLIPKKYASLRPILDPFGTSGPSTDTFSLNLSM